MDFRLLAAGDAAWLIELPERIDAEVNAHAIRIANAIETSDLPVTDVVVGYRSVMVYVDPLSSRADGIDAALLEIAGGLPASTAETGSLVEVPVCYDGPYGPDLADVAAFANCSVADVIALHLAH